MLVSELLESTDTVTNDLLRLLVGQQIGHGCSRHVFELRETPHLVIKIERSSYNFQNIREFDLWDMAMPDQQDRWLAPIHAISPCGTALIMARTEPVPKSQLPTLIPEWLSDTKQDNWGWYDGRVVCHDYGHHIAMVKGLSKKVRRADWR